MRKRKINKLTRVFNQIYIPTFISSVLLIIIILALLITAVPFFITKFTVDNTSNKNIVSESNFEPISPPDKIKIYLADSGKITEIKFEDYIKGVVACEMPSTFHEEALKAQAVAARTYSVSRVIDGNSSSHPEAPLCNSTHCQVYKSPANLKEIKGSKWMKNDWKKICKAVNDTKGQMLYYKGELVKQALFHSSSGGRTENSEDVFAAAVPYLVSVDSPYEESATHQNEKNSFSLNEFNNKIKENNPEISFGDINESNIKIISRSTGNRVEKIQIGNGVIEGRDVREALGLPSANFEISFSGDNIIFTSDGSGHGVGMSQYGADGMARNGYNYKQILNNYYSGTEIY